MQIREATEIVSDLASQQWGVLTAAQARQAGVPAFMLSRLADQGILVRVRHGVYAMSATPFDAVLEVRAQWLALEPTVMAVDRESTGRHGVVVSHETAAELLGIGDLPSEAITFTTVSRRQTKQPEVRFHTGSVDPEEITRLEGLPVTTAAKTVLDLARAGHEPSHLTDLMKDAVTQRLTTPAELATALAEVAEVFGAVGNTEAAMRTRLDELWPEEEPSDEHLTRVVQQAMAPLQRQLQQLFDQLAPQLQVPTSAPLPALRLPVEDLSPAASSLQEALTRGVEESVQSLRESLTSAFHEEAPPNGLKARYGIVPAPRPPAKKQTRSMTRTLMPKPKTRSTHSQITAGLREFARQQKLTPNLVYNRFFREVFLAELMAKDPGWVLKGGTNLYCLIPRARHTQDLDLYRQDSPTGHRDAAQTLIHAMDHTTVGPYTFEVRNPRAEKISGTIDNVELTVLVRFGTREFSRFNIDVSGDLEVPTVTEPLLVTRSDPLNVPFVPHTFPVLSYPVENQLADKTCAMYEIHGTRASTRYRDLYDIALIALELEGHGDRLHTALDRQAQIRG